MAAYILIYAYMLKKYSHFSDLQETDKYKANFTKARMYASLTGHAPSSMAASSFGEGGVKNFRKVFAGGEGQKFLFW